MALGRKTGGRVARIRNKGARDVIEPLEALGCDPITGMARIVIDEAVPIELWVRMFSELVQYVAPKRRATSHLAERYDEFTITWQGSPASDAGRRGAFAAWRSPTPAMRQLRRTRGNDPSA